jgi:hypothetical protein
MAKRSFLIDITESNAMRYFGDGESVKVWQEIELLTRVCFGTIDIRIRKFEWESALRVICDEWFWNCSLKSICIRKMVTKLIDQLLLGILG